MKVRRLLLALSTLTACAEARRADPPRVPEKPEPVQAAPVVAAPAQPPVVTPEPVAPAHQAPVPPEGDLERQFIGEHRLGVNRVTDQRRPGSARVEKRADGLYMEGSVAEGAFNLSLRGKVDIESATRFTLTGEISGTPDMRWAGEAPRARATRGRFLFEATKGRKFWRMYEVDGRECVCQEGCGNDFCYIDVERALVD